MPTKTFETERNAENFMPYRKTDDPNRNLGRVIIGEAVKYAFAGAVAGVIAWAGISAKQQVMEAKLEAVSQRAVEDRASFERSIVALTGQLALLNSNLNSLAIQQARMEAQRLRDR